MMTWAILNQYGSIEQGGFDTKEEATAWLKAFKNKASICNEGKD